MTCEIKKVGDTTMIICGRGGKRSLGLCKFCMKKEATKLCDQTIREPHITTGRQVMRKRTCDAPMCVDCAASGGENVDYCPSHAKNHPIQESLLK